MLMLSKQGLSGAVRNPFGEEERMLFTFVNKRDLGRWNVFADSQQGGNTTAALTLSTRHPVCLTV